MAGQTLCRMKKKMGLDQCRRGHGPHPGNTSVKYIITSEESAMGRLGVKGKAESKRKLGGNNLGGGQVTGSKCDNTVTLVGQGYKSLAFRKGVYSDGLTPAVTLFKMIKIKKGGWPIWERQEPQKWKRSSRCHRKTV